MLNLVRLSCVVVWGVSFGALFCGERAWGQTQTAVIPAGAELTAGTGNGNAIPLGNFASAAYQALYGADQIGIPAGSTITGMQLRLKNTATTNFPAAAHALSKYEVRMSTTSRTPATMSTTFAENMSRPVLVRAGSLNIAPNSYTSGASGTTPENWGPVISFTTPYVYAGGELVMEFREEAASASGGHFADVFFGAGIGTVMSAAPSTATVSPSLLMNSAPAVRLTFTPPAAPFQTGITRLMILDDLANIRGNANTVSLLSSGPQTNQYIAGAEEMRRLGLGSRLVGMHYRNSSSLWPVGSQSFTKYDIQLARALATPATMSGTIALNAGPDVTTVRSGAMNVPSEIFGAEGPGARPAPWVWEIPFTRAYTYLGGPLFTLVRHDGVTGSSGVTAGTLSTDPEWGTRVRGQMFNGSSTSATANGAVAYSAQLWSVDSGSVAPNVNADIRGPSVLATPYSNVANTSQFILNASQLTYLPVGCQITGLTFRNHSAGSTPINDNAFTEYRIYASSAANRPLTASETFAENEGPDMVQVRSGGFALPAGSLPGGPSVSPFGPTLHFDRAFIYQGGDLCITMRHSGTGADGIVVDGSTDVTLTRTISGIGINATTGGLASGGPIVRFMYNPSVVAPAAIDNTPGGDGYPMFLSAAGNVLQAVYAPGQLRGLRAGSLITGMSLRSQSRFAGFTEWPATETNLGRFDVTLSTSPVLPGAMSNTFANNIGADAIVVRAGAMKIPARAFPYVQSTVRPNENEWFVQFTEPFVYKGGPLSVTVRNDTGAPAGFYADVFTGSASIAAGRWATGLGANAVAHNQGVNTGAMAARFVFVPRNYCPADLDNDGVVDDDDFTEFLNPYNLLDCADAGMAQGCPADLNFDRIVDDADFSIFVGAYDAFLCE